MPEELKMKTKSKYQFLVVLLLFGAQLLCASNGTESDSTKGKYPLNDPRNPSCPCHKYQKLADMEYAQLLKKSGEHEVVLSADNNQDAGTKRVKRVRIFKWGLFGTQNHKHKVRQKKCFRDRLSRCFHF